MAISAACPVGAFSTVGAVIGTAHASAPYAAVSGASGHNALRWLCGRSIETTPVDPAERVTFSIALGGTSASSHT